MILWKEKLKKYVYEDEETTNIEENNEVIAENDIDVEEIDFDSKYQITMRIHKDN